MFISYRLTMFHLYLQNMTNERFQSKLIALQSNMLNFAYLLTSNRDDAYDLVQDTMLKVLDNEDKYTENVNFKGWVLTVMRNIFINGYRKASRTTVLVDRSEDLYLLNLPQDSGIDDPEGSLTVKEINAAVNSFEDEYRIPFAMHLAGYKYQEIAEKVGLPLGTIKSRIFFARKRLRNQLRDLR